MRGRSTAIFAFTTSVLKIVAPLVPIVKFQSAYFEKYLWEGVEAYYSLIAEAAELGLLVIGDVKRGDIATTAAAYAAGTPGQMLPSTNRTMSTIPDAITVNPFYGSDTDRAVRDDRDRRQQGDVRTGSHQQPRIGQAAGRDAGRWPYLFATAGRTKLAPSPPGPALVGRGRGFSPRSGCGRRGDSAAHHGADLAMRLLQSIFLLPYYGAQGAIR